MKNRLLALLLALCLMSALPSGALAEGDDIWSAMVDAEVPEADALELGVEPEAEETDFELPPVETNQEEAEDEAPAEPAAVDESAASSDAAPVQAAVSQMPEFKEGFVAVRAAVNVLCDEAGAVLCANLPEGTVLYALRGAGEALPAIAYETNGQVAWGQMDPDALTIPGDEVIAAYVQAAQADPNAVWLREGVPLTHIDAAKALLLNAEALRLSVGESFALAAEQPEAAGALAFSALDEAVAGVSPEGVVTALAAGETRIVATSEGGALAVLPVSVVEAAPKATESIHFSVDSLILGLGETSHVLETVLDQDDEPVELAVTYASGNSKYVAVNAAGAVKGVKKGSAVITAVTESGMQAACRVKVLKAPSRVTVSPTTIKLGMGQIAQLQYTLPKNTAGSVTWSSSNTAVAEIEPDTGVVTAIAPGTVQLTARTYNNKTKTVKATVYAETTSVSFPQKAVSIGIGEKLTLKAEVNAGASDDLEYTFSDEAAFTNKKGILTAKKAGVVLVTATAYNGLSDVCEVTIKPAPTYVKLPYSTLILGVGDAVQLTPDAGGATDQFTYKSSKSKVASVSSTGMLRGLKAGTATITIKTYNKKAFKLKVKVSANVEAVQPVPSEYSMDVGESFTVGYEIGGVPGRGATFKSSDTEILSVDARTGLTTALSPGEASVVIYTTDGRVATCRVTVADVPTGIRLKKTDYKMGVGQTEPIAAVASGVLTYESGNPGVATVSSAGVITAVSRGNAEITLRIEGTEFSAAARVTVYDAPSDVLLDVNSMDMNAGDTYALKPIIPEGSWTSFSYSSSDEKVATVNADGLITAVGSGTAVVTVTTYNGKTAEVKLYVVDLTYPESLALLENVPELNVGETYQVQVAVEPADAQLNLVWSSSKESVAKVSETGLITAVNAGSATIKAVSQKNTSLVLTIPVVVNEDENLTLVIPERTTDESGIKENLAKIDAIRRSAIYEIDRLNREGTISNSDATKRKSMVNNIFDNYAFPWKTLKLQKYWKAANSEGGVKDFKTDRVYYGMPYISGSGKNRHYNVKQALSENRYYDSGDGYYILNQDKLLSGKYVGNDCSGLCNVSIWGTDSSHTDDRTDDIASSSAYRTITDTKDLRPGDLICKSSAHVVMFLYYANADKTQIMMIENGGAEPGTNTVHCDIYDLSYYTSRSYKIRRLSTLD